MSVEGVKRGLSFLVAGLLSTSVNAGSSLSVVVSVVLASGACMAFPGSQSVSVSCGLPTTVNPLDPPVTPVVMLSRDLSSGSSRIATPPFIGFYDPPLSLDNAADGTTSPDDALVPPSGDPRLRQVGILPASVTGAIPIAVYSGGVNVSGWRVVSTHNVEHVELTLSW